MKNPVATIQMKNGNKILVELFPKYAPNAVNSFIKLANKGALNNKDIKRIVPGFVIQPIYDEYSENEDYRYELEGEFSANGYDDELKMEKWSVAMAGDGKSVASGSCYYITLSDDAADKLNGKYTNFGKVISGFEEIERIENVATAPIDIGVEGATVNEPIIPETIMSVNVETFGIIYDEPKILRYL